MHVDVWAHTIFHLADCSLAKIYVQRRVFFKLEEFQGIISVLVGWESTSTMFSSTSGGERQAETLDIFKTILV